MSSLSLVISRIPSEGRVALYEIRGAYFLANTLAPFSGPVNVIDRINLNPSTLSSEPIIVYTTNGWVLLVSRDDTAVAIASSGGLRQPTEEVIRLIVPINERLERMQLPPFNPNLLSQIENITRQHIPLYVTSWERNNEMPAMGEYYPNLNGLNIVSEEPAPVFGGVIPLEETIDTREWVRPPEIRQEIRNKDERSSTPINIGNDELIRLSYESLIKQLYGIPVQLPEYLVINGLRANFVPFQQIGQMLSNNQIERYIIDPLLQPWAGPPGTEYRIFTFFGKNGVTYLVKARYNSQTNQILP